MEPDLSGPTFQQKSTQHIHIGTGGWGYFPMEGDKLTQYASKFDIVEVNNTFYQIPKLEQVKTWLLRTTPDFTFSVKCHREVTHQAQLQPTSKAITTLTKTLKICEILDASHLVFQLPPSFEASNQTLERIDNFLAEYPLEKTTPVIEVRGKSWLKPEIEQDLTKILDKNQALRSKDISRFIIESPQSNLYTRIFGRGTYNRWEFTNLELQSLIDRVIGSIQHQAVLIFHSIRMYETAAKSKYYLQYGTFPPSKTTQLMTIDPPFIQNIVFPTSQESLFQQLGWRVIELPSGQQIHFGSIILQITAKRFQNLRDLRIEIDNVLKQNDIYQSLW